MVPGSGVLIAGPRNPDNDFGCMQKQGDLRPIGLDNNIRDHDRRQYRCHGTGASYEEEETIGRASEPQENASRLRQEHRPAVEAEWHY